MKYTVYYSTTAWYSTVIEANSFDEAGQIAEGMDRSEFEHAFCGFDWDLERITDENDNSTWY